MQGVDIVITNLFIAVFFLVNRTLKLRSVLELLKSLTGVCSWPCKLHNPTLLQYLLSTSSGVNSTLCFSNTYDRFLVRNMANTLPLSLWERSMDILALITCLLYKKKNVQTSFILFIMFVEVHCLVPVNLDHNHFTQHLMYLTKTN